MPLITTTIGAFPKPAYVTLPDWFSHGDTTRGDATLATTALVRDPRVEASVERGIIDVVAAQVASGVDVPTDGEIGRENYVHYHCRHLAGFDFQRLTKRTLRAGSWTSFVPTVVGPVEAQERFLDRDYVIAQRATDRPLKMTLPGPLTIIDSTADAFYGDETKLAHTLAVALRQEVRGLVAAGCRYIQVDEPVFARYPDKARHIGFDLLDVVFADVPASVDRILHVCCGYPDTLDNPSYPKADPAAYARLLPLVEASTIDTVSIEDAHRHNDPEVLACLETTKLVLGSVAIANSEIESVDEIDRRVTTIRDHVPHSHLELAPDCGLGLLTKQLALAKLANIRHAADRH